MRILLDHNVPHGLRNALTDHEVHTANYRGWSRLENGDLLEATTGDGYDILLTCDQGMRHEQELGRYDITVVTLMSGDWNVIRQNVDLINQGLATAVRGEANPVQLPMQA